MQEREDSKISSPKVSHGTNAQESLGLGCICLLYILPNLVLEGRRPGFPAMEESVSTGQGRAAYWPSHWPVLQLFARCLLLLITEQWDLSFFTRWWLFTTTHVQASPITKHFCYLSLGIFEWQGICIWFLFLRLLPCMVELDFLTCDLIGLCCIPQLWTISTCFQFPIAFPDLLNPNLSRLERRNRYAIYVVVCPSLKSG